MDDGGGVCFVVMLLILLVWIMHLKADSNRKRRRFTDAQKSEFKKRMAAGKKRAAKRTANKKAKQLEQAKNWERSAECAMGDLYTPQKYYDEIVDKVDSSNSEEVGDALDKLRFTIWTAKLDKFIYSYFDKHPLSYLERKANELKLKVPEIFEKTEYKSWDEVKKGKIIELLVKAKWRIQTKKEKQGIYDWKSMYVGELKAILKLKGLPVKGRKSELVSRLDSIGDSSDKVSLVVGLNDFKLDRMDLIIKKLSHKNRLVRKAAANALSRKSDLSDIPEFQNLENRNLYRYALQESLQNVARDQRKEWPYRPGHGRLDLLRENAYTNSVRRHTENIMKRLEKLDEGEWEHAMKVKKHSEKDDTEVQLRLIKAKGLFDEGLIDKDEYKKMKKDILDA